MKRGDLVTERGIWLQAQVLHPGAEQTVVIMQDHILHQIPREHTACTKDLVPWSEFQKDRGERYLKSNTLKPFEPSTPKPLKRVQFAPNNDHADKSVADYLFCVNRAGAKPIPIMDDPENDAPTEPTGPCPEKGRKFDFECDCGVLFRSTAELEEHKANCMVVNSLEAWYT